MKRRKCAVCGDLCQTNVRLKWKRNSDKKIFHICVACAENNKVNEDSVKVSVKKSYTTIVEDCTGIIYKRLND